MDINDLSLIVHLICILIWVSLSINLWIHFWILLRIFWIDWSVLSGLNEVFFNLAPVWHLLCWEELHWVNWVFSIFTNVLINIFFLNLDVWGTLLHIKHFLVSWDESVAFTERPVFQSFEFWNIPRLWSLLFLFLFLSFNFITIPVFWNSGKAKGNRWVLPVLQNPLVQRSLFKFVTHLLIHLIH